MKVARLFMWGTLMALVSFITSVALGIAVSVSDIEPVVNVEWSRPVTQQTKACGKIVIAQRMHYLRDCSVRVNRFLFDSRGARKQLEDVSYKHPPTLGTTTIVFEEDVPCYFAPGEARYQAMPSYYCNVIQQYWMPFTRRGNKPTVVKFDIVP